MRRLLSLGYIDRAGRPALCWSRRAQAARSSRLEAPSGPADDHVGVIQPDTGPICWLAQGFLVLRRSWVDALDWARCATG